MAAVALAAPSAAPAQVTFTPERITVRSAAGAVQLGRERFSLRVLDAGGRTVLRTVPGARRAGGTLYAPLVAVRRYEPELAETPPPDPPRPARDVARRVSDFERLGDGVRLQVGAVVVTVRPGAAGTLAIDARGVDGVAAVAMAFRAARDETFHGFGGFRRSTNARGRQLTDVTPQFVSSRGYGVVLDQEERASWRMASDRREAWRVTAPTRLRLVVAPGEPLVAMVALNAVAGRDALPPEWSTGPILSRGTAAEGAVGSDLERIDAEGLGLAAYSFVPGEAMSREALADVFARLRERGIRPVVHAGPDRVPELLELGAAGIFGGGATAHAGGDAWLAVVARETGMSALVPDMLNRAIGGAWGVVPGIGAPDSELFVRRAQVAVFTPYFRTGPPWGYDAATLRLWRELAALHDRARPLVRRLWDEALQSGVPPMRPLWLADPSLAGSPRADDQWLLGDDVLVAPVVRRGATKRKVALPPGCWRREGAGEELRGGRTVSVDAPIERLPWFVRCETRPL